MKDALPARIKSSESGIINLENSDSGGSHWVAYYNGADFDRVEYFDSFGVIPHPLVERYLTSSKKPLAYSTVQYQHMSSILCGWFCLLFINERFRGTHPWRILCNILRPLDDTPIKSYKPFRTAISAD